MTPRFVRPSILSLLFLAFFINGCATTNKASPTDTSTAADTGTATDTGAAATTSPSASADTAVIAVASANTSAVSASAADSGTNNSDLKEREESFNGPVFRNAAPPAAYPQYSKKDPWEPMNRAVFQFNESVDDYVLRPMAEGYKWLIPVPIRMAVGNVFSNLDDIPVTLNNLLQLKFGNALTSSSRLVVNSTFGLAGLVDIASDIGLEKHDEDFGQTLGYHGLASGPYVVLPFLGPSSMRDAGGRVVDIASDPVFIGSFFVAPFIGPVIGGTRVVDTRAGLIKSEKTLEEAALDKYEFVRDAYLQRRRSLVYDGNPPQQKEEEDIE